MNKHTQGKWAVGHKCSDGIRIEVDGKCSVANVWGDNNQANARLIAAAPELLEALKKIDCLTNEFPDGGINIISKQAIAKAEKT